jgi:TonB family protein
MIKISLIILSGFVIVRLLRRQSAATRHLALTTALVCAALSPVLERIVPAWDLGGAAVPGSQSVVPASTMTAHVEVGGSPAPDAPPDAEQPAGTIDWATTRRAAIRLWLAGSVIGLLVICAGLGRMRWRAARAERLDSGPWRQLADLVGQQYGIRRPVTLLQGDHPSLLVTWGLFRPKVMLPDNARGWTEDRMRVVLGHELAHVQRWDWAVQMGADLLRAAYWFNPLLWIASRRLREESERACDDAVLGLGVTAPQYASHLLDLARAASRQRRATLEGLAALAMTRQGGFERRVRAMLDTRLNRNPASRSVRTGALSAVAGFAVLVGGFGAAAQSFSTLSGSVVDPLNGLVPEATVTLTNVASQAKHEVRSNQAGQFEFVGLPPGDYQLEAKFPGFRTLRGSVTVSGRNIRRDLEMTIGSLTETVTIASRPGVRAETPREPVSEEAVAARPPQQECRVSGQGGNIRPPRKIRNVNPLYPDNPDGSVQGVVILEGRIGTDGTLGQVKVLRSPHPDLERAAVDAFERWQFTPTLLNCVPVEVAITATMNFVTR